MMAANSADKWDIFIAHAGDDKLLAEKLYDLLASKCDVFLDSRCLSLGDDWSLELPAAQRASAITLVLISSKTEKAYYEREEIAEAVALARQSEYVHKVIPIYLNSQAEEVAAVPYGLRVRHGLQLSEKLTLAQCAEQVLFQVGRLRDAIKKGAKSGARVPRIAPNYDESGFLHQPQPGWFSPVRSNHLRYKLVAFDLDGTLLRGEDFVFSWERVWKSLGFGTGIQTELKREYRRQSADGSKANRIAAYRQWCEKACDHFKDRGLTRSHMKELSEPLTLTHHCLDAISEIRSKGIVIAIISGGIQTFLEDKLPDFRECVDFVLINELVFSESGSLVTVRPTAYDFEGKAEALDLLCKQVGCNADETVFVGDRFNDEKVMLKAGLAIAYPDRDESVKTAATVTITEDNLMAVVPHLLET
jgi:HAD superfamily phosphoserine phosphatase-like hydrolase